MYSRNRNGGAGMGSCVKAVSGFTLLEVLIAIGIMILLVALTITAFHSLNEKRALSGAVLTVKAVLSEARSKTVSSKNDSRYGVYFDKSSDRVVTFVGDAYTAGAATNSEVDFSGPVEIHDVSLSGGKESVVFKRITGEVAGFGTITLRAPVDGSYEQAVITVYETGVVE